MRDITECKLETVQSGWETELAVTNDPSARTTLNSRLSFQANWRESEVKAHTENVVRCESIEG